MTDLLSCPFCGSPPRLYGAQVLVNGECPESIDCDNSDCHFNPSTGYLPFEQAVAAWNIRIPPPAADYVAGLKVTPQQAARVLLADLALALPMNGEDGDREAGRRWANASDAAETAPTMVDRPTPIQMIRAALAAMKGGA